MLERDGLTSARVSVSGVSCFTGATIGTDFVDAHRVFITTRFTLGTLVDVQTTEIVAIFLVISVTICGLETKKKNRNSFSR